MADKKVEVNLLKQSPFNKIADSITTNINHIYQRSWFNTTNDKDTREGIAKDINSHLDNILSNNLDKSGLSNISNLYKRIIQSQDDSHTIDAFKKMFSDQGFMASVFSSYSQNRYLYDYDAEVDTILKYMSKLEECIAILRDNVISTDHFSKDYISAINISDTSNDDIFNRRLDEIKATYGLLEKFEKWYTNGSKYGEEFVYHVPYSKEISRLVKDKDAMNKITTSMNLEAGTLDGVQLPKKLMDLKVIANHEFGNLEIELCKGGVVTSIYENYERNNRDLESFSEQSMTHVFSEQMMMEEAKDTSNDSYWFNEEEASKAKLKDPEKPINMDDRDVIKSTKINGIIRAVRKVKAKNGPLIPDNDIEDYMKDIDKEPSADDGLIDMNKLNHSDKYKFDIPGCILKTLDRHNTIPIIIESDDICLGYYYFEFQEKRNMVTSTMKLSDPMINIGGNNFSAESDKSEHDRALRYISNQLSKFIDSKFINRNQDLKKEIYAILKYNQVYNTSGPNKMRVTFIPPEDVTHIYFELDPITHRGISDIHKSLLPAKLYTAMYITASIMIMTRGFDKRVYYVNPGIEANLTEALMNVINQVKQGNFGIRQIRNNLNQVLNITGKFNDYFILKNPNGDSPVNMEVIQGQNIDIKTDLMNILEEMAVNSTNVPMELVQTRQNSIDYAIQLTMSNSKFLRFVFKRQSRTNVLFSRILEKIYNYHFHKNDTLSFTLPPPTFLSLTNNSQFFENLQQYAQLISTITWDGDPNDENGKNQFMKEIMETTAGSYYNKDFIEKCLRNAKQKAMIQPLPTPQPQQ